MCGASGLVLVNRWLVVENPALKSSCPEKSLCLLTTGSYSVQLGGQWLLCFQASFGAGGVDTGNLAGISADLFVLVQGL